MRVCVHVFQCRDLHQLNSSDQCAFVNATDSCHITEGLIDYTVFVYCELGTKLIPLAVTILVSHSLVNSGQGEEVKKIEIYSSYELETYMWVELEIHVHLTSDEVW